MPSTINKDDLHPQPATDILLQFTVVVMVAFSLLMLYSTTGIVSQEKFHDPYYYVKRQLVAAVLGFVTMLVGARINIEALKKISPVFFICSILLLFLPFIPGISGHAGGATRWVSIFGQHFQPGELVKVLFVIFMAGYFSRHETKIQGFTDGVFKPFLLVGVIGCLLLLQPDFGSTVVIALVTLAMAMASGVRLRYIVIGIVLLITAFGLLVYISPYRASRVMSFLSPWEDARGRGYQLIQSLIAVGTGQWTGLGLGASQQKLFFLPAAHTDFLFAVIAEELGFVGCISVMALFLIVLWRGMKLAAVLAEDTFSFSLAVGLTMLIVAPAFLNVGVVIGLLPTKGMVLPLLGYGGSSLITSLLTIGLLLSLRRNHYLPRN